MDVVPFPRATMPRGKVHIDLYRLNMVFGEYTVNGVRLAIEGIVPSSTSRKCHELNSYNEIYYRKMQSQADRWQYSKRQ